MNKDINDFIFSLFTVFIKGGVRVCNFEKIDFFFLIL